MGDVGCKNTLFSVIKKKNELGGRMVLTRIVSGKKIFVEEWVFKLSRVEMGYNGSLEEYFTFSFDGKEYGVSEVEDKLDYFYKKGVKITLTDYKGRSFGWKGYKG